MGYIEWEKIKKTMLGRATESEKQEVKDWKQGDGQRETFYENGLSWYRDVQDIQDLTDLEIEHAWQKVKGKIPKQHFLLRRIVEKVAVVAVFSGLFFGIWGMLVDAPLPVPSQRTEKEVKLILSGKDTRSLIIGKPVSVDVPGFKVDEKGDLVQLEGEKKEDEKDVCNYCEIIVPKEAEYHLTLADGSQVFLNAESSIRFPDKFTGNERKVFLQGEAYFQVAHDEHCPFYVVTDLFAVKVLGTAFNVRTYRQSQNTAALVSGKISITNGRDSLTLMPGEQCNLDRSNGCLEVVKADLTAVLAWKNGEFVFKNTRMEEMMNELSRWYDMEIEYESEELKNYTFYIYVERSRTLKEVLDKIALTGRIKYRIDGKKVFVQQS